MQHSEDLKTRKPNTGVHNAGQTDNSQLPHANNDNSGPDVWQADHIALHHAYNDDDHDDHGQRGHDHDDNGHHYGRDDDRGNGHHQNGHDHHPGRGHHYGHDDGDDDGGSGNQAPVAQDASASGDEDSLIAGQVTATDVDSPSLTYALVGGAVDGNGNPIAGLSFNPDGSYSFQGPQDFNGAVSFTYIANDGALDSNVATVSITVDPVNDAPVTTNDAATTDENTAVSGTVADNTSDPDNAATDLTYSVVGAVPAGLTFNPDGSFNFDPSGQFDSLRPGDSAQVTFEYLANDGTSDSNISTVAITVDGVNDAPVTTNVAVTVNEHSIAQGTLADSTSDPDNDPATELTYIPGYAYQGVTFNSDGTWSFDPSVAFAYLDTGGSALAYFRYSAFDGTDYSTAIDGTISGEVDCLDHRHRRKRRAGDGRCQRRDRRGHGGRRHGGRLHHRSRRRPGLPNLQRGGGPPIGLRISKATGPGRLTRAANSRP